MLRPASMSYTRRWYMKYVQLSMHMWFAGIPHAPISFACKIILALFWFVAVVTLATFSANLVAFLAVTRGDLPFHTLDEVAEDRTHILQLPDNSLTVTLLQVRTGLWEVLQWNHFIHSTIFFQILTKDALAEYFLLWVHCHVSINCHFHDICNIVLS